MSLLWIESFETTNNTAKYIAGSFNTTPGRTGNAGTVNGGFLATRNLDGGAFTYYHGFAVRISAAPGADHQLLQLGETYSSATQAPSIVHVGLYVTPTRQLKVTRGANLATLVTGPTVLLLNTYYFVEIKVKCHDSAGEIELRIDTVPEFAPMSGLDTRNGGAGIIPCSVFTWPAGAWQIDDWYICTDQGSINNSFRGVCAAQVRNASIGNGGMVDMTPSSGTDHGAMVDEAVADGDTTYVSSNTPGHIDTYNFPDISITGEVVGVMVCNNARKTDVGVRNINSVARIGGTNYENAATPAPLASAYTTYPVIFETDPSTGSAWVSQAAVNAAEFGPKIG